jgi:hypothetical protein
MGIEQSANPTLLRQTMGHELSQDIADDGQENDGNGDCLWLEIIDCRECATER